MTVELAPHNSGTVLELLHDRFVDDQARTNHQRGWAGTFTKLDALLASL